MRYYDLDVPAICASRNMCANLWQLQFDSPLWLEPGETYSTRAHPADSGRDAGGFLALWSEDGLTWKVQARCGWVPVSGHCV